jgi:hypothetical protein
MANIININKRPTCVNHGCDKPVTYTGSKSKKRYISLCSTCQKASYGERSYADGVIPFKKKQCDNSDGRLGFKCVTNFKLIPSFAKGMTEIDHKNGNHMDNRPSNLQELCVVCHKIKGQLSGDFGRNYSKDRKAA